MLYKKIKETYSLYERQFSALAIVLGFIIDNLTLQRIDLLFENLVLIFYILLIFSSVVLLQTVEKKRASLLNKSIAWLQLTAPFLLQYALGGLFSGLSIFYFRSATLAASWPFLFMLIVVLIGNEVYAKTLRKNIVLQTGVLYFALFSFSIFFIPILVKDISVWVFLLSGAVSVLVIALFVWYIKRIVNDAVVHASFNLLCVTIGAIYFAINVLYFLNVIPPIPLSMKERQLGYDVDRVNGSYVVAVSDVPWWQSIGFIQTHYKQTAQEPVYFFTSVFAPTKFQKTIIHEWQQKNVDGEWTTVSRIPFTIRGGRDGGYRGYSYSNNITSGRWRVQTVLETGQIIGRKTFDVIITSEVPATKAIVF